MSTELTVSSPSPANLQLVALTPAEIPEQQAKLADWCLAKMKDLGREYRELSANLAIAKKNRWSRGGLISAVSRTRGRIQYYRKIRAAVQAGYLIIPNFPIEVMAVRVNRSRAPYETGRWASEVNRADPQLLPVGVGRYVNEITDIARLGSDEKGVPLVEKGEYREEVDFPVIGVKPIIMEATSRAMKSLIFDRIGIANHSGRKTSAGQRRADPIVIGQILDPKGGATEGWRLKPVSFFVAWWLDTAVL